MPYLSLRPFYLFAVFLVIQAPNSLAQSAARSCVADHGDSQITACTEAIQQSPITVDYHVYRGIAWGLRGEHDRAISDFDEAIRLAPHYSLGYLNRGISWAKKNDYDRAIEDFNAAIQRNRKNASAYLNRGLAWHYYSNYDRAIADFDEAIRLSPNDSEIYNYRGNAWVIKKEYDRAIADYNQAIRLSGANRQLQENALKNKSIAEDAKRKNEGIGGPSIAVINLENEQQSDCWTKAGDKAIDACNRLIATSPNASYFGFRGGAWLGKNDVDRAIADYSEAILRDSLNSTYYYGRATALLRKNEFDQAIADFEQALRLTPVYADAQSGKALAESRKIAIDEQKKELKRVQLLEAMGRNTIPWKNRLDSYIQGELREWLTPEIKNLEEIPAPSYPPALSLKQEAWETNNEFEGRVQKAREERREAIERIQSSYRSRVETRNRRVAEYNKIRQEREAGLSDKRRQLILAALAALNPPVSLSNVAFDQRNGALIVSAEVDGLSKQTFAFNGTPQEFRRLAMTSPSSMKAKPEFMVSNSGEFFIQAITVEVAGTSARGVPSVGVTAPVQLATVNLPAVAGPVIAQQSGATVDRNQVEQILYRDENEMLRKQLEDQRRAQEQALAGEQAKVAAEIAKLRAEADTLRKQPAEVRPAMNVATVREAHALVIGNSAYLGSNSLPNPVNDAKAVTAKLRSLGFRVTEVANTSRDQMVKGLAEFSKTAANADLTLFFYAGHGVQIAGTNYMIPVDMNLNDVSQASLQAVSLNSVVEQYLPGKTKLVFLDACRDNPLMASVGRGVSKGLAPINVSEGTLISYATKDGQTAEDGVGQTNSPFTTALIEHLSDPDDIAVVLRTVRSKVMQRTNNRQQPWEYGSLTGGALVLSAIKPAAGQGTVQPIAPAAPSVMPSQPSALRSIFDRLLRE